MPQCPDYVVKGLESNVGYTILKKRSIIINMKISRRGSSMKQLAYARRVWGAKGEDKKTIALDVGYAPSVANSIVSKIESKPGFNNAMARLASDSGNLAVAVMSEFKARGLEDFTNKDLVSALNAIAGAWDRFNKGMMESTKPKDQSSNRLRTVVLQKIYNQAPLPEDEVLPPVEEIKETEFKEVKLEDLDF